MRTDFERKFFKKSPVQPPNGVLLIFKLPFPNGSYRNGVCRALWAISTDFLIISYSSEKLITMIYFPLVFSKKYVLYQTYFYKNISLFAKVWYGGVPSSCVPIISALLWNKTHI